MTAQEARQMTRDLSKLTFMEKLREIWICGRINQLIAKRAKEGEIDIYVKFTSDFGKRIANRIQQYYNNMGYDTHFVKIGQYGLEPKHDDDIQYIKLGIGWRGDK